MTLGPTATAAKKWRTEKRERAIRAEADKRPPRVEYVRIPSVEPIPTPDFDPKTGTHWGTVDLNERPKHRVIQVPLPAQAWFPPPSTYMPEYRLRELNTVEMRAIEYRAEKSTPAGGLRIRWWGWETPADGWELRKGLSRAQAYAGRVLQAFEYAFGPPEEDDRAAMSSPFWPGTVRELRGWLTLLLEDIEQYMGKP